MKGRTSFKMAILSVGFRQIIYNKDAWVIDRWAGVDETRELRNKPISYPSSLKPVGWWGIRKMGSDITPFSKKKKGAKSYTIRTSAGLFRYNPMDQPPFNSTATYFLRKPGFPWGPLRWRWSPILNGSHVSGLKLMCLPWTFARCSCI